MTLSGFSGTQACGLQGSACSANTWAGPRDCMRAVGSLQLLDVAAQVRFL